MKKVVSLLMAAILMITTIIAPLPAYAAETGSDIYVSASGNDSNAGTESKPVKTIAKALSLVESGGTIHLIGTVAATSWSAPTKDVTFTGGTLDINTLSSIAFCKQNTNVTFENINIYFKTNVSVYACGANLTMGAGVKMVDANGAEVAPINSLKLYGGGKSGTTIDGDTNLTILSGTYNRIFGGGYKSTLTGNSNVYVGGTVNNHADFDVADHSGGIHIYGGGNQDTINGSSTLTFAGNALSTHLFGGSYGTESSIGQGAYIHFAGGQSMSLYGGSNGVDTGSGSNVLMTGGEIEQVFGGCSKAAMVGDVDIKVLGGKVTRRIYGGCYNEASRSGLSIVWGTEVYVTGNITLTIGGGVSVTKDAVDANGDAYSDMSVSAGSRYKPQSAEVTKLVWTDSAVSDVSGLDAAMSLIISMSGGSSSNVADSTHTHTLTYTASGDTITESCTCGHSATAVLSVIEKDSRVYNGEPFESEAEYEIDYWNWLGSRDLTIEYANNINAGTATASITYSGATASVNFDIEKATQPAPTGLGVTNETILGKGDGTITGLELTSSRGTSMEYSINGEFYNKVTVVDSLFMPGTYYVRYAEGDNYKASPATIVTIADGAPLTVTVPTEQVGYTLTTSANELSWRGDVALSFSLAEGYSKTDSFAVKVNGETVILDSNGQYIISFVEANSVVTVEGVADITAPEAEITLDTNKWNSFWSGFGFDLFFKETQSVTITAADVNTGSGLDKIYYYLSEEELTLDEVKAITNWTEYKNAFNINPDKEYVIYAKATDKAGNAVYVNSDGIVLDATMPVISQVTNGGTYYGDTTFKADDTYLDSVTVDGNAVSLTDGKYTIVADNAEHTIVATDKAGNTTTYQISVYKIYTVTFKVDGNTHSTVQVNHGANAIMPQIPVKEGYTQVAPAWDKDGKNITEDTTITAVYTINKYNVTFKADGTTVETIQVEHGGAIANGDIPTIPSKTGYTQVAPKWDKENFANITSDMTVNAIYTINKYNVVFKADGATVDTIEVEHGGSITNVPQVPAKVGYHASWDSSAFTNITSDMEVNAVYDIHKYTVTFKVDGAVYKEVIVAHGGAVAEIPAIPTKTGYTQVAPYWDVNDFSNITSNKTVNAVYTINQYTVTFKNAEDTVKVFTVNHGSSINDVPQLPEKTGYHGNWDKTDFTNITSDVTVNAVYEINKYTVKFMADGKVIKEFVIEHGNAITGIPAIPQKTGYTDTEPVWSSSDFSNITSDRIVTAIYTVNRYTVTFVADDKTVEEIIVAHGDAIGKVPQIPEKVGYHGNWDVTDFSNVTSDMTVKAVYEINKYTITFKAGGKVVKEFVVEHGSSLSTIPNIPEKNGYTQTAPVWDITDFANVTSNMTVNAVYTPNVYKVTFVLEGATLGEVTVKHGESVTSFPEIPAKEGYHVVWDVNLKNVTSDMTANAAYEINKYTVTFKADGNIVKEFTIEHGGSITDIPKIPAKEGYTETAPVWDVTDFSNITADVTVNAVYTQDAVIEESQDTDTEDVDTEIDKDAATDDADTDDKGGFPIVPVVVGVAVVGGGIAVAVGTGAGGAAGAAGATGHGAKAGRLFGKWRRRK